LGKLLALIIMGYSLGQWGASWLVGRLFDLQHTYALGWKLVAIGGIVGAAAIFAISPPANSRVRREDAYAEKE